MENSASKTAKNKKVRASKPTSTGRMITDDDIRRRAFEIYLENRGNSNDLDNWCRAERELKGSLN